MILLDKLVNFLLYRLRRLVPTPSVVQFVQKHLRYIPAKPTGCHAVYGPFYEPYYNVSQPFSGTPCIYSKEGRPLESFFLRDVVSAHVPYSSSRYFAWDRFNFGLSTHFYAHGAMLETMGNPDRRYGIFVESEGIIPHHYAIFRRHPGLEKDFDAIFTFSEPLLDTLPNAKYFPACSSIWYSQEICNGQKDPAVLSENAFQFKEKNISMICSARKLTPMQLIRHQLAHEALRSGKVDVFGAFQNPNACIPFKSAALSKYRFHIAIENDIQPFYFTEKIMDCFAAMTIPIYLGAPRIGDFFNSDGILFLSEKTPLEKILAQCTEEEYIRRLPAVQDNYRRCLNYLNLDDKLYEEHFL